MLKKIMMTMMLLVGVQFAAYAQAPAKLQALPAQEFKNQWDQPIRLTAGTEWVIFSHHKDGGQWVKETFDNLNITDPKAHQWLYVADVSQMPSLITRWFAIPKMQDFAFPIALSYDEQLTATWPQQPETVSVYKLYNLVIKDVEYFSNQADLQAFLKSVQ